MRKDEVFLAKEPKCSTFKLGQEWHPDPSSICCKLVGIEDVDLEAEPKCTTFKPS